MNLFLISTDSKCGKTFIAAGIAAIMQSLGYTTSYLKPVLTGAIPQNGFLLTPELSFMRRIDPYIQTSAPYIFQSDAIPILAAKYENTKIMPEVILREYVKLSRNSDIVIIESNSGILTPFSDEMTVPELILALNAPVIIVTTPEYSSLEKTLLAISCAKSRGIDIRGVIINKCDNSNVSKVLPKLIEKYGQIPVLGMIKIMSYSSPSDMIDTFLHSVNLEGIFGIKIPKLN